MRGAYCSFQAEVVGQDTLKLGLREREGLYHLRLGSYHFDAQYVVAAPIKAEVEYPCKTAFKSVLKQY